MKRLSLVFLSILVSACTAPKYGTEDNYIAKCTFIKTEIASDELLVESDYKPVYDPIDANLYFGLLAADQALQRRFSHFKVLSLEERTGNPYVRPYYYVAHIKFYKDTWPLDAVKAESLLKFNQQSMYLLER